MPAPPDPASITISRAELLWITFGTWLGGVFILALLPVILIPRLGIPMGMAASYLVFFLAWQPVQTITQRALGTRTALHAHDRAGRGRRGDRVLPARAAAGAHARLARRPVPPRVRRNCIKISPIVPDPNVRGAAAATRRRRRGDGAAEILEDGGRRRPSPTCSRRPAAWSTATPRARWLHPPTRARRSSARCWARARSSAMPPSMLSHDAR